MDDGNIDLDEDDDGEKGEKAEVVAASSLIAPYHLGAQSQKHSAGQLQRKAGGEKCLKLQHTMMH